ncbi:MAG: hypothetical protein HYR75_03420 [Gemmatimonadetes bacterium]|nr:hypothetical protein [Gemmatimonadota bacterium]MBI3569450.1 hypothetical protein [Gemmatimonadota bacterium]
MIEDTTAAGSRRGPPAHVVARIAATSWLILFLELALIRFLAGYVRVFAFYTNFVIIAAFLGMGTGLLRSRHAGRLRWTMPVLLVLLFGFTAYLAGAAIDVRTDGLEWLWGVDTGPAAGRHVPLSLTVVGLFALTAACFVPLGALLGAAMAPWRALPAYAADLGGSLVGVLSFTMMSAWSTPPVAWFATAAVVWLALVWPRRALVALSAAGFAVAIGITARLGSTHDEIWSPYYRITTEPQGLPGATTLNVNGALHQVMLDFSRGAESPRIADQKVGYERPYRFVSRLDTVLVVGAGTGNDLAILLGLGAKYIDAVEIDPVIARIGKASHPMHPYDDPRVHLVVTDARAFLRAPPRHYDVITFGTLDSQTLLGGMNSVRLDNYVYTQESFRAARAALHPDGSVVMYHLSGLWFIAARLFQNLEQAFGKPPRVLTADTDWLFSYTFVAGAGAQGAPAVAPGDPLRMQLRLSTDDWPFPYLRGRRLPTHYAAIIAMVLVLALGFVAAGGGRRALAAPDWPLFLIGAGFLLLETKSITTLSLLFGSTWTVNAAVIAAILAVALLAAISTDRGVMPPPALALGTLAVLLAASTIVRPAALTSVAPWMRWLVAGGYVGFPILAASYLFSRAYAAQRHPTAGLAYNILGAVAGGVLEYASMAFGLEALSWMALALYALAVWLLHRRDRRASFGAGAKPASLPASD